MVLPSPRAEETADTVYASTPHFKFDLVMSCLEADLAMSEVIIEQLLTIANCVHPSTSAVEWSSHTLRSVRLMSK